MAVAKGLWIAFVAMAVGDCYDQVFRQCAGAHSTNVPIVQRPRTWPFQGQNTGSNPVGDATLTVYNLRITPDEQPIDAIGTVNSYIAAPCFPSTGVNTIRIAQHQSNSLRASARRRRRSSPCQSARYAAQRCAGVPRSEL